MAEGREDKSETYFRFILQRLPVQKDLQNVKSFQYCIKLNYFICHFNDNRLIIDSFQNAEASSGELEIGNVEGYIYSSCM